MPIHVFAALIILIESHLDLDKKIEMIIIDHITVSTLQSHNLIDSHSDKFMAKASWLLLINSKHSIIRLSLIESDRN